MVNFQIIEKKQWWTNQHLKKPKIISKTYFFVFFQIPYKLSLNKTHRFIVVFLKLVGLFQFKTI